MNLTRNWYVKEEGITFIKFESWRLTVILFGTKE